MEVHPPFWADTHFWVLVAFVIFVVVVWKPARQAVLGLLDNRTERIRKEIDEATRLHKEAQDLLSKAKRSQREAAKQAEQIMARAQEEAELMTGRMTRDLEALLQRREQQARDRIAQAEQQALADVRAAAADISVEAARRVIAENISDDKAATLIDASIQQLPQKLH